MNPEQPPPQKTPPPCPLCNSRKSPHPHFGKLITPCACPERVQTHQGCLWLSAPLSKQSIACPSCHAVYVFRQTPGLYERTRTLFIASAVLWFVEVIPKILISWVKHPGGEWRWWWTPRGVFFTIICGYGSLVGSIFCVAVLRLIGGRGGVAEGEGVGEEEKVVPWVLKKLIELNDGNWVFRRVAWQLAKADEKVDVIPRMLEEAIMHLDWFFDRGGDMLVVAGEGRGGERRSEPGKQY